MLEGGLKSIKIGLAMGVKIGGDAEISVKITHLLVVMHVRLSQKIGLLDLTNRNQFINKMAIKYVRKVCGITGECV